MKMDKYLVIRITQTGKYVQLTSIHDKEIYWILADVVNEATRLREKEDEDIIEYIEKTLKEDKVSYEKEYIKVEVNNV